VATPQANNPSKVVPQDSTFWSSVVSEAPGVFNVSRGLVSIAQSGNPIKGAIQAGRTFGLLQQEYPNLFTNPQQSPTMQSINEYGGMAAKYADPAMNAYNFYENARQGNYLGAGINVGQGYNDAIKLGLIDGTPINAGYLGAAAGGMNLYQGFQNKDFAQIGVGGAQVYDAGSTLMGGSDAAGSLGSVASVAGLAYSAYGIGKTAFGDGTAKEKARAVKMQAEDAAAAYYTAGLSAAGQYLDRQFLGGQTDKIRMKAEELQDSPVGMVINPAGFITNKLLEKGFHAIGSKKGDRQLTRDMYRETAVEAGILTPEFEMELADGIKFDAGADGSTLDAKEPPQLLTP
jgi:hypothetical protein